MHTVGPESRSASGELLHKEHVRQLGNGVFLPAEEGAGLTLNTFEVDAVRVEVRRAGDLNDAGPLLECRLEAPGEHEVPQMVDAKRDLEAIRCDTTGPTDTGVVDQHINGAFGLDERLSRIATGSERGQVELEEFRRAPIRLDLLHDGHRPFSRSAGANNMKALLTQIERRGLSNARRDPGDHRDTHRSTVGNLGRVTRWPEELNADHFFLRARLEEGAADRAALRIDDRVFVYAEVDRLASGYARRLIEEGVVAGDRVLIVLPDGIDFVASLFGTLRIGAVVVMLNPGLSGEAMGAIIDRSRATAAVVHSRYRNHYEPSVNEWAPELLEVDGAPHMPNEEVDTFSTEPEDPAIWLFSGGTTGEPKAVVQTHRSLVNTTKLYGQGALGLQPDDITMSVPKLYFGYATGSNLLFPFSVGASSVLFEEHPTPEVLFRHIEMHRPTVLVNVPSAINQMVSHPDAGDQDLSSLRFATSAGEALPETLYHRWKDTFGVELLDGLGTAEMWHIFVTNTLDDVKPGTLGKVVPGFEIKACDDDGNEVESGEVGRLWVKGDSLGLGYWEQPEKTEEAFRGEWFVGGDLVSIDEDGYVIHGGRADDAIKVKGKWFRPQEVESALLEHDAVQECAVVAVTDESGLAKPVAFVVTSAAVGEQDLIDWVLARLEAYKHPRRVFFVEELPQTHLGKVDRSALKGIAEVG